MKAVVWLGAMTLGLSSPPIAHAKPQNHVLSLFVLTSDRPNPTLTAAVVRTIEKIARENARFTILSGTALRKRLKSKA